MKRGIVFSLSQLGEGWGEGSSGPGPPKGEQLCWGVKGWGEGSSGRDPAHSCEPPRPLRPSGGFSRNPILILFRMSNLHASQPCTT